MTNVIDSYLSPLNEDKDMFMLMFNIEIKRSGLIDCLFWGQKQCDFVCNENCLSDTRWTEY